MRKFELAFPAVPDAPQRARSRSSHSCRISTTSKLARARVSSIVARQASRDSRRKRVSERAELA
jgi:hypothetical protein